MVSVTTGGPQSRFGTPGAEYEAIDLYLKPIEYGCIQYMGMELADRFVAWSAGRVSDDERRAYLDKWSEHLLAAVTDSQ